MKTGIIDVGGGLRGIYGAGVLDRCMEEGVQFDCCIGVSAGSANMSSYVAGQHGRNKPFYQDYSFRKEYMSVGNLVRKHSYLDLEYVYGALSNRGGENPLDYPAVVRSPAELVIVATEARTGKPRYFTKADLRQDDYRPLMASCCIPVVDQPYFMDGVPYYDGGLADPVPLEKAFALGCDRVAVILTKPVAPEQTGARDKKLAKLLRHRYPAAAKGPCPAGRALQPDRAPRAQAGTAGHRVCHCAGQHRGHGDPDERQAGTGSHVSEGLAGCRKAH